MFQNKTMKINRRYKDLFDLYIYKGEATPFTLGVLIMCAFCFLLLIVATFTQFNFSHYWFKAGEVFLKPVSYSPQIPAVLFVLFILGRRYSLFVFLLYLITGLFFCPIFAFGGGIQYVQNYFFGYLLSSIFAILIAGRIFRKEYSIKTRIIGTLVGIFSIHIIGFLYCVFLALFRVIDFNLLMPILNVVSGSNLGYDIFFSLIVILVSPYIKNILWICMKPTSITKKSTYTTDIARAQVANYE